MQNPTDQAEASIPTERTVTKNSRNWKRTVNVRRKAAKRTHPFDLTEEELDLVSPDEDTRTRKKPRLEEPSPTTTDEATRDTASPHVSEGLNPPTAGDYDAIANADPMTGTQPNTLATRATARWTLEDDAKLTRAVAHTSKKKQGEENKNDWAAISALVAGRTRNQCCDRWHNGLDPSIGRASGHKGKWSAVEDSQLKDAVQRYGDKDWIAISLHVPGRTRSQCNARWRNVMNPSTALTAGRTGTWEEDEDSKLKDAVKSHGDKDWGAISALVPGRTRTQCCSRWHNVALTARRKGSRWTAVEDSQLKDAVKTHGDRDWAVIAALVPSRTKHQCWERWKKGMDPNRITVRGK
jgi:hypothetical protein